MENNMRPKVTIICPVYKVEGYIGRAIESVQNQTLKEWEFYIVDDGSPDKSGEICDAYAKKDSRIKVIHKENGGAPSARNVAMDLAVGEFMYFMDGDDWAEPTMLQDMYDIAKRDNAQLVVAGFFIDTYYEGDKFIRDEKRVKRGVYPDSQSFREAAYNMFDNNMLYPPWNKLFSTEYLNEHNIRFPLTFWDDFPFVISVIEDVERVSVTDKMYYHFIRARAESETAAYRANMYEKREEENQWMVDLYKHWNINDYNSKEMIARRYIERFIGCIENLTNKNCKLGYREKRKIVADMFKKQHLIENVRLMRPQSKYMKILVRPIKWRNITLTLLEGSVISFVKSRNTKIFATLKAKR